MQLPSFSLEGKVALVTGATKGIGFGLATALGEAGAAVAFCGRGSESVLAAEKAFADAGIRAKGYVCDVSREDEIVAMIASIASDLGTVDILVNNAGITKRVPMTELSTEDFREVLDVDLVGPFLMSRAVLPGMIEKGRGKIINICSLMSELGRETLAAYSSAKGGLRMLTRNIASEFGRYNIQCNGIGPGYILTPMTRPLSEPLEDGRANPFNLFVRSKTPADRWGTPRDLMGPVVFLASEASDYINGQILYVDGGLLSTIGRQYNEEET